MDSNNPLIKDQNNNYKLSLYEGESYDLLVTITDKDGTAVDIAGTDVLVEIKKYKDDTALISGLASNLSPTTDGKALFQITPTHTGTTLKAGRFELSVKYTYDATHIKKIIGTLVIE